MQKARCHPDKSRLQPLVSARFQGLFHSSIRGAFHLSLTVLVHYRSLSSIQPQRMVPLDSNRISPVPSYSGYCQNYIPFRVRDFHPLRFNFPANSTIIYFFISQSYNPNLAVTTLVWAFPRSLATTWGITIVFFSWGYLDVSVLPVCLRLSLITYLQYAGLPHSDISGSMVICTSPKLFAAYHVLHRL